MAMSQVGSWQRMHQISCDGEREREMQEVEKKKGEVAVLSFQTAAGRGENHGRTDDTQWMAPVCVLCPISGFFSF